MIKSAVQSFGCVCGLWHRAIICLQTVAFSVASLVTLILATIVRGDVPGGDVRQRSTLGNPPLRVVYFYSLSCHECKRVKNYLLQIASRWGDRIALEFRSVDDIDVFNDSFLRLIGTQVCPWRKFMTNGVLKKV